MPLRRDTGGRRRSTPASGPAGTTFSLCRQGTLNAAVVGHVSTFCDTRTSTDRSSRGSRSLWKRGTWNCTTAPGRPSGVSDWRDVAIEPGLAVAEDGGARVAGRGLPGHVEPVVLAGGDEDGGVDAAERLGVGVVDGGGHGRLARGGDGHIVGPELPAALAAASYADYDGGAWRYSRCAPGVFAPLVRAQVFKTCGGCEQRSLSVRFRYTPAVHLCSIL